MKMEWHLFAHLNISVANMFADWIANGKYQIDLRNSQSMSVVVVQGSLAAPTEEKAAGCCRLTNDEDRAAYQLLGPK
jgi:hypothetical protein